MVACIERKSPQLPQTTSTKYQRLQSTQTDVGFQDASTFRKSSRNLLTSADELTDVDGLVFKGDRWWSQGRNCMAVAVIVYQHKWLRSSCERRKPSYMLVWQQTSRKCAQTQKEQLMSFASPSRPRGSDTEWTFSSTRPQFSDNLLSLWVLSLVVDRLQCFESARKDILGLSFVHLQLTTIWHQVLL